MSAKPALVVFTSGINDDPHDADVAEVVGTCTNGLIKILFANGDWYAAYPEELEAVT